MTRIPRLPCCALGRKYVRMHHAYPYDDALIDTAAKFRQYAETHVPTWRMEAKNWDTSWTSDSVEIQFCPFCAKPVPKLRLRENPPKRMISISDGGYYCDTCKRRLNECKCAATEQLWEAVRR